MPPTGIALDRLAFSGLRGKGLSAHAAPARCACSARSGTASRILRRRRADAVLGMGGYVCFPGG